MEVTLSLDFRRYYYMQVVQKNLGERPTTEILYHHPDWVNLQHNVQANFFKLY